MRYEQNRTFICDKIGSKQKGRIVIYVVEKTTFTVPVKALNRSFKQTYQIYLFASRVCVYLNISMILFFILSLIG